MPAGIFKRIPRHIALLAAVAIPLALITGYIAILHFHTPSNIPPTPAAVQPSEFSIQNSPAPAVARLTPPLRLDPFDVLAHVKTTDPALKAWLDNWQTQWSAGHDPDAEQVVALNTLLDKSPLGAVDLLDLAHAFHHLSDDSPTSARFYDAASTRIELELNEPGLTVPQSLPVLLSIKQHIDDYKHVLWPMIEERHQKDCANTLYRIYSNFVRCAQVSGDADLIKAAQHPAIGAAECLYVLGRTDDAKSSLERMTLDDMTANERVAHAWIYGLVLYKKGLFSESVAPFQIVAKDDEFQYTKEAWFMQIGAMAEIGEREAATSILQTMIAKYHLSVKDVAQMLSMIDDPQHPLYTPVN